MSIERFAKILRFAEILEGVGCERALDLIEAELLPLAWSQGISLWDAAWEFSNQDEEQDTSWFQLFHALQAISDQEKKELEALGVCSPGSVDLGRDDSMRKRDRQFIGALQALGGYGSTTQIALRVHRTFSGTARVLGAMQEFVELHSGGSGKYQVWRLKNWTPDRSRPTGQQRAIAERLAARRR